MKSDSTELIFVLDKSGSMSGLEDDTIGGFNSTIEKQSTDQGEVKVTTVLFDTKFITLHDRVDLKDVPKMTRKDYFASGCTALLDAVGMTIARFKEMRMHMDDSEIPAKTLMVITTDGYENSSNEYTYESVKKLITAQRENGWEFIFMGAEIDSEAEAEKLGINKNLAIRYMHDDLGVEKCYESISYAANEYSRGVCLEYSDCFDEVMEDYRERSGDSDSYE